MPPRCADRSPRSPSADSGTHARVARAPLIAKVTFKGGSDVAHQAVAPRRRGSVVVVCSLKHNIGRCCSPSRGSARCSRSPLLRPCGAWLYLPPAVPPGCPTTWRVAVRDVGAAIRTPLQGGGDQRAQPGAQPPLARAAACLARENGLRAAGTHCPASIRARDFAQGRRCAPIASRRHRCGTHNGNRFAFCARREAKRRSVLGPTNDAPGPRSVGCHHVRDHGRLLLPTINRSFLLCSRTSPDRAAMKCLPRGLNMSASKKRRKEKEKNHRVPPPSASALSAVCSASVFRLVFQFDFESSQFHHRAAQRGEGETH